MYPAQLCKAICVGFLKQIVMDREGLFLTMMIDGDQEVRDQEPMNLSMQMTTQYRTVGDAHQEGLDAVWDASQAAFKR